MNSRLSNERLAELERNHRRQGRRDVADAIRELRELREALHDLPFADSDWRRFGFDDLGEEWQGETLSAARAAARLRLADDRDCG